MNGFITPRDIVRRLFRRHRFWFHGKPEITLTGDPGGFGSLTFDFGDQVVEYKIYIHDRDVILDASHMAIENFNSILEEIITEMSD